VRASLYLEAEQPSSRSSRRAVSGSYYTASQKRERSILSLRKMLSASYVESALSGFQARQ
jgi:hypothetical protein